VVEIESAGPGHAVVFGVSMPRIVRVAGATITSFKLGSIASRDSRSTGRRLSGRANVYQRILPRRTELLPTFGFPGEGLVIR
jgi:hypothetical protein